jgi:hypothetical protein
MNECQTLRTLFRRGITAFASTGFFDADHIHRTVTQNIAAIVQHHIVSAATFAGASAIQLSVFLNAGRGKKNVNLQLNHLQWLQVKDQIRNLNAPIPIMYCDEFECKCMNDDTFNCPGWDCFGTVSPNGVYRKCLHYYKPKN